MSVERLCGEELMEMDDLLLEKDLALEENTEVVEDKPKEEDQQKCPLDPSSPCEKCLAINQTTRRLFGVRDTVVPTCECLDICVQNVRLICTRNFSQTINLGSVMGCRGGTCPLPSSCRVVVLCASEDLLPDCSGVHVNVRAMVVFEDASGNPTCCIILNNIEFDCTSFVRFPSGTTVTGSALRNELKIIDGSCVVVNLTCTLSSDRRTATVSGTIVEKLWKEENLWVEGILPYPHSITVKKRIPSTTCYSRMLVIKDSKKRIVDDIVYNPFL